MIGQATHSTAGFWDPNGDANLVITIILFAWSAVMVWRGALLGARGHAKPRLFVAIALTAGVFINVAAFIGWLDPVDRAAIARAVTWALVVSLGFTALTGLKYGNKVKGAVEVFEQLAAEDEQDD